MTFATGVLVGVLGTLTVGLLVFQARIVKGESPLPVPDLRMMVAVAALVVAVIALVHANDKGSAPSAAIDAPTDPPAVVPTSAPPTSTPPTSSGFTTVQVPDVTMKGQGPATTILEHAGLKVTIDKLPLTQVPAGFVVTQAPVAGSTVTTGSTVVLGVATST